MPVSVWEEFWKLLGFLGVQYSLGRRGSYPYGLLVEFSLFKITILVIISDIIQTIVLLNLFEFARQKIKWLRNRKAEINGADSHEVPVPPPLQDNSVNRQEYASQKPVKRKKKFLQKLKKLGDFGLICIAALPYGGGALTGSIVAISMKLDKRKALILITTGCIIGSFLFYMGFAGILSVIKKD